MSFDITKEQQKVFIENFLRQVLDLSLQLVDAGRDKGSPGATVQAVGKNVIAQIYRMHAAHGGRLEDDDDQGPGTQH